MSGPYLQQTRSYDQFQGEANRFFEAQLETIGLSREQVEQQSIPELEDSLMRVDEALRAPESFGVLRLSATADASVFLVKSNSGSHIEVGVVPLLLARKKAIIERLRLLRAQRPIKSLTDLIDTVPDQGLRQQLSTELEATRQIASSSEKAGTLRPDYAFIAMAMDPADPQLEDVIDAIKDGAQRCGVTAERVDQEQSNEPITKRMLDSIDEAAFVIVDLSYPRPNVYYEAGYAQGLGKTPVYLARKGTEIPFDLKDYPVILYPNLRELKTSLGERLKAIRSGRK
jgi:hypothetical protein